MVAAQDQATDAFIQRTAREASYLTE